MTSVLINSKANSCYHEPGCFKTWCNDSSVNHNRDSTRPIATTTAPFFDIDEPLQESSPSCLFPSIVTKESPEMKEPSTLLADEMNKLSLQEREDVYADIHGVRKVMEESTNLIKSSLNQLENEINEIPNTKNKAAYLLAEQISKEYVHDTTLRIKFLRSVFYNAKEAAYKLLRYFELKLELFGLDKLTKTITIQDLNDEEEDMKSLQSGRIQVLPYRDRAGRTIIGNFLNKSYKLQSVDSMLRAVWYTMMSALEDEETQRHGIVLIFYSLATFDREDPSERILMRRASAFSHALPYRVACVHFCFDKKRILTLVAVMMKRALGQNRARMRFHCGSHTECQFSLMTFGIPLHVFPVTSTGDIKYQNHTKWIRRRKSIERLIIKNNTTTITNTTKSNNNNNNYTNGATATTTTTTTTNSNNTIYIDLPTKYDVLLGRGRPTQNHTGNEYLREIIEEYAKAYEVAKRGKKPYIANTIIQLIKQTSGRFLKQDKDGWWIEVSDDIAREKVCNGFRTLRSVQGTSTTRNSCTTSSSSSSSTNKKKKLKKNNNDTNNNMVF